MRKTSAVVLALALVLSACDRLPGGGEQATDDGMPNEQMIAAEKAALAAKRQSEETPEQRFASTIAALNSFAMGAANLAKTNASSAAVKKFAKKNYEDHATSTMYLKLAVATVPGVMINASLSPEQQADLAALQAAKGPAFDALYAEKIKAVESKSLETMRSFAKTAKKGEIKGFADYFYVWPKQSLEKAQTL